MADRPRSEFDPQVTTDLPTERSQSDRTTDLPVSGSNPELTTDLPTAQATDRRPDTSRLRNASDPTESYDVDFSNSEVGERTTRVPSISGYQILGELGRGGMGVVYKARQTGLKRLVALKMILSGPQASTTAINRFLSEAQAVARFQHPNIVQIYEIGENDGMPYFSLEFVEGGTLTQKTHRDPQPPKFAAELVEKLARAMQYAHERGIVHRDLKPANILLAKDGTPKITDFGLAKEIEKDSGHTQSGQVLGTPSYMAPEQARGEADQVGPLADVWALGAILYDLLTGRPPFAGSSVLDTLEMVRTREPVAPSTLMTKLPRDLETICMKCLQKEEPKRFASASELADDLQRFLEGRPILARPVSRFEKAWRWAKRNPVGTLALVLAFLVLFVPSILSWQLFETNKEVIAEKVNVEKERDAKELARAEEEKAKIKEEEAKRFAQGEEKKAIQARSVAADQRRLALDTIRGVLLTVDSLMRSNTTLAPVRIKILEAMLRDLDKVRDHALQNPLEDRTEAVAYSRIGDIYFQANRVQDAEPWLRKAFPVAKKGFEENPNDLALSGNMAGISSSMADLEWRLGNETEARKLYADALKIRIERFAIIEEQAKQKKFTPDQVNLAREGVAKSYFFLGFADLRLGNAEAAIPNFHAADRELAKNPQNLPTRRFRGDIQVRLGDAFLRLGKLKDAETVYRKNLEEREKLLVITTQQPYRDFVISDIAQSHLYLGDFAYSGQRDFGRSLSEYTLALTQFEKLLASEKDNLALQQRVAACHYRLGVMFSEWHGVAGVTGPTMMLAAQHHFAKCLELRMALAAIDPKDLPAQVELMLIQGRAGIAWEAEKRADAILARKDPELQTLFQVACGYAVACGSATDTVVADRSRKKAFEALELLISRGWKNRFAWEFEPDLSALNSDTRFRDLLEKLSK